MNPIQRMTYLEKQLSPVHVQQIRQRCTSFDEYLEALRDEIKECIAFSFYLGGLK